MLIPSRDRMLCRPAALLAVLAALAAAAPVRAEPVFQASGNGRLLIGLIPEVNIFRQKARFKPLGEYLGRKIGVPVQLTISRIVAMSFCEPRSWKRILSS